MNLRKVLKYELLNIVRNRWVFFLAGLLFAVTFAFIRIAGNFAKAILTLSGVASTVVPLIAILFTVVYWYHSERFTELLLTQPIRRTEILAARWLALSGSMAAALGLGILLPFAYYGGLSAGVLLVFGTTAFLAVVFITLGFLVATVFSDRMKGIGVALGLWFYFAVIHDGLILLLLLAFRDYPLDLAAGVLGSANPIGLVRVCHLLFYDAPMLLSYSGALVRGLMSGAARFAIAGAVALAWLAVPALLSLRIFRRKDFQS